jgi:hypothetical protein
MGEPDAPGTVRCAILTFEMHQEPDAATLTIKAPEDAQAIIDALFRAVPAGGRLIGHI